MRCTPCTRLIVLAVAGLGWALASAGTTKETAAAETALAPRLLHYPVVCHAGERCKIECFQGGRIIVSRTRIEPGDGVTLVLTDGFSDRLQPLWLEIRARSGGARRTVLLPRDALCDFQGLTIEAFPGSD